MNQSYLDRKKACNLIISLFLVLIKDSRRVSSKTNKKMCFFTQKKFTVLDISGTKICVAW